MSSNLSSVTKAPELRRRVLFTLLMIAIYRIGIFITIPIVDRSRLLEGARPKTGGFLKFFDMLSGGGLEQLSVLVLGIMPYITASIILQLLTAIVPSLDQLQKEGEQGRKKINQYTRYAGIFISLIQGFFLARSGLLQDVGFGYTILVMIILATGTAFVMWVSDQISEKGIGNGSSLIIFSGIVARIPNQFYLFVKDKKGSFDIFQYIIVAAIIFAIIAAVIFFERAFRKIPVEYAKRVIGRQEYQGQVTHLPLKINIAGVIPPLFASALLMFPGQLVGFSSSSWLKNIVENYLDHTGVVYNLLYIGLIVFFCYFYTAVTFNPVDVAENLRKNGGFIPGVRPGKQTADYLDKILSRLTLGGALYISAVCVLPVFMHKKMGVPFYFGGTSLLIVVGVALDTVQKIQEHLISHNYESVSTKSQKSGTRAIRLRV